MSGPGPKMYGELAEWFHLITPPSDYATEARFYADTIEASAHIPVHTLLELGSGGGNNASHMKERFALTLVDLSPPMLEVSRSINPGCEHLVGDMRTLRLERHFDAVFIHDAIVYLTTREDLLAAIETAFLHCRPGGVAVFAPDDVRESFRARTDHGGEDGPDRGVRFVEWVWDPDPADDTYLADYAYLLRQPGGDVSVLHDRHTCGLFSTQVWLDLLTRAGFDAESRPGIEDETAPVVFVGVKPES